VTPTRIRLLAILFVIAAVFGWAIGNWISGQAGRVIPIPWLAAATMWVLAIAIGIWTLLSRPRLQRKPGARPLPPLVAARTAALAMAASRTGALVAGLYVGIGVAVLPVRMTPSGSATLWASVATVLGSLAVVGFALWLERLCQIPEDDGDEHPAATPA
jgi:hypothetical protein